MKINAHVHVNFRGYDSKRIIDVMDRNGFDCSWLLTWEEKDSLYPGYRCLSIEDVYETYLKYPSRIIPMYAPDPKDNDCSERFLYWHRKGIKGCAELKSTLNWQSEEIRSLLKTLSGLTIPVLFHMEESAVFLEPLDSRNVVETTLVRLMKTNRLMGIPGSILNALVRLLPPARCWKEKRVVYFPGYLMDFASLGSILEGFPDIAFIGHGPLFWKHVSADVHNVTEMFPKGPVVHEGLTGKFLKRYDNLYADISGESGFNALTRDRAFGDRFLAELSHKVIFGTDNTQFEHEGLIRSYGLSKQKYRQIMGENALRLLPST